VGGFSDSLQRLYDVTITVGSIAQSLVNPACAGSPYFPAQPTKGIAIEANCDLDGRYVYLHSPKKVRVNISMITVFLECACNQISFTPAIYSPLSASRLGPLVTQTLPTATTTNADTSFAYCTDNYQDSCPAFLEVTLDNLDPLPDFITLILYNGEWSLEISPTLSTALGTYTMRVRSYLASPSVLESIATLVATVTACEVITYLEPTSPPSQSHQVLSAA